MNVSPPTSFISCKLWLNFHVASLVVRYQVCEAQSAPAEPSVKTPSLASSLLTAASGLSGGFAVDALHDRQPSLILQAWTMKCLLQVLPLTFTPLFSFSFAGRKKVSLVPSQCGHVDVYRTFLTGGWEGRYSKIDVALGRDGLKGYRKRTMPSLHNPENI